MSRLDVLNLSVHYSDFSLKDVSFSCDAGEIVALVGKNGAGKTTTIDSIVGLVQRDAGRVLFDGEELTDGNIHLFKQKIGYVSGISECYPSVRVRDLLSVVSKLYENWDAKKMRKYLQAFDIGETKRLSELSSGTKVKLSLAIAFSHSAKLLLLDEPTTGLDPIVRGQVLEILRSLSEESGTGVLFSSHITQDIEKIASRVLFMGDGELACDARIGELSQKYIKVSRCDFDENHGPDRAGAIEVSHDSYVISKDAAHCPALPDAAGTAPTIEEILIYLNGGLK